MSRRDQTQSCTCDGAVAKDFYRRICSHEKTVASATIVCYGDRYQAMMWSGSCGVSANYSTDWLRTPEAAVRKLTNRESLRMAMRPYGDKLIYSLKSHCDKYEVKK